MKVKGVMIVVLMLVGMAISGCADMGQVKIEVPELGVNLQVPILDIDTGNFDRLDGSGRVISERRSVADFDRISFAAVGDISIFQGDKYSLTVFADDNLLSHVETKVEGSTLVIDFDEAFGKKSIHPSEDIRFELEVIELKGLDISGLAEVDIDTLRTDEFEIQVSGMAEIRIDNLKAEDLRVEFGGLGKAVVAGQVGDQIVRLSGGGEYTAGDLESRNTSVVISGVGAIVVWATETLDLQVSGGAAVSYYGDPRVNQSTSGLGSITRLGKR